MSMEQPKVLILSHLEHTESHRQRESLDVPRNLISSHDDCPMHVKMRVPSTSQSMVELKPKSGSICFRVDSGKEIYNHLDRRVFGLDAEVNSCSNQVSHTQNGIMRPAMSFRVEEWWAIRLVCLAMDGLLGRLE